MPWPVRSTRFGIYHGTPAANTQVLLGTVPAGKKWLLKEWSAFNFGAATRDLALWINVGGTLYVIDWARVLTGNPTGNSNRHTVLNAGESLQFTSSTAQLLDFSASGAQLG